MIAVANKRQPVWASTPIRGRLEVVRWFRQQLATLVSEGRASARPFAERGDAEASPSDAETLVAQILPLCDACRFLEREAEKILAPRVLPADGRPFWLRDVEIQTYREPHGVVLILAASNYPYFLPGVQMLQALVAGNTVILKPGNGGLPAARTMVSLLPGGLVEIAEDVPAFDGVDKVILTGKAETGQAVLAQLAPHLTPATMELSGDDPVFVRADADLDLVVKAVEFGRQLNRGQTCIAPRRIFAARGIELPWPVTYFDDDDEALALAESEYALGATVFGREPGASEFAKRICAGVVVVNDMIVPTADPRLAFGGRGRSGFGLTRGAEGLLEMTALKSVITRRGKWRPHLLPPKPGDAEIVRAYIELAHGPRKLSAAGRLVKAIVRRKS
jgi:acyl-CoA reductase-like NAD-dependent aldehyde dehydrogenase